MCCSTIHHPATIEPRATIAGRAERDVGRQHVNDLLAGIVTDELVRNDV